ncbi:flippase [Halosolutus gelatinilyticus]|uniref:flippase n=1 Tax=Halosolutus gelatinilyticus TaxID=2931975 RepID=UPI001FF59A0A|nr:flippase [Halosolutus gelatinilyticus]
MVLGYVTFARILDAQLFGVFVLFIAVTSVFEVFLDLGIDKAMEKRISEQRNAVPPGDVLTTGLLLKTGSMLLVATILIASRGYIDSYVGADVTMLLVPVLVAQQLGWLILAILRGEQSVATAEYLTLVQNVVFVLLGVLLILRGFGVEGLITGYGLGWLVLSVVGYRLISTELGTFSIDIVRSLFDFSWYNFVASSVMTASYRWIDILLIGFFLTRTDVAAYEVAWQISVVFLLLPQAIALTLFPSVSERATQGQFDEIERLVPTVITWSIVIVVPGVIGGLVLGNEILSLIFGPEFAIAAAALVIILFGKIAESLNYVFGTLLLAIDRPGLVAKTALVFVALNVGLNVALIPRYGIVGAAVATTMAYFLFTAMNATYLSKYVRLTVNVDEVGTSVLSALAMGSVLWGVQELVRIDSLVVLLATVAFGGVVYTAALLSFASYRQMILDVTSEML